MSLCPLVPSLALAPGPDSAVWIPGPGDLCVVVGSGKSGQAAAKLVRKLGGTVRLLEAGSVDPRVRAELEGQGVEVLEGPHTREQFAGAALVVPSPGVPLRSLLETMGLPADYPLESGDGPRIAGETELAFRCLGKERIVAVTGTSGKTTTVHLIARMLEQAGRKVCLAGNVGTPLSQYILDGAGADVIVLEVSSFQLQTCTHFHPHVAVLMNISPNHLDYHRDMDEYIAAKMRLFACQDACDKAVVPPEWHDLYTRLGFAAREVPVTVANLFPDTPLFGVHNALNAEIAYEAVRDLGVDFGTAARAVSTFTPLPHRLERVTEKDGVLYVNDSKCTTLSSLRTALEAFERPILLLCGGRYKGGDPHELDSLVKEKVRLVAGFGESRGIFQPAWEALVPVRWFDCLKPAVLWLHNEARSGDVVLLSPGTASFDLYKGMAYRGADFKNIVAELCMAHFGEDILGQRH